MIDYIVTPYTLICLMASSVALITARIYWKRSKAPGGKALSCFLILVSFWTACYAVEFAVVGPTQKLVWAKISTGIFTLCPPLLLIMSMQYSRYQHWLMARWRIALLYIIPFINFLLIETNDRHHLVWTGEG